MSRSSWQARVILTLLIFSAFFFGLNYVLFNKVDFMLQLVTLQLAFLPISVILTTFFLARVLAGREKRQRLEKLNLIIGVFYSELGTRLLEILPRLDANSAVLRERLRLGPRWSKEEFAAAASTIEQYRHALRVDGDVLQDLRAVLTSARGLMMGMLENPNLLEHEAFTELLRSLFHMTRELGFRQDLCALSEADRQHLAGDLVRVYTALLPQWLAFMQHLRFSYPYLYSLESRLNPFDPTASVEVTD